jgi:hypothetical protein
MGYFLDSAARATEEHHKMLVMYYCVVVQSESFIFSHFEV